MKKPVLLFLTIIMATHIACSQCNMGRYRDFITSEFMLTSDIVYGSNINQQGEQEDLKMDIYSPANDFETDRAVVVVCHGGYFLGGDKAGEDVVDICQDLAKMGYIVASINYRIGIPLQSNLEVPYGQAVVRAVQDLRAAIRWLRKDAANGNQFGIDPDNIYAGGDSAGGFMTLHLAYMDEEEIPAWLDITGEGLEGGLEGASGNEGYSSEVKGIFSVSGALGDAQWIDQNDTTPACLFHGDNDQTVTIDSDLFVLFGILEVTEIEGSNPIAEQMDNVGIEHCYKVDHGLGHVPYLGNAAVYDTTLSIISNFLSHYICGVELDCDYREIQAAVNEIGEDSFSIFPNPASDVFRINLKASGQFEECRITDMNGRMIMSRSLNNKSSLEINDLPSGIYVVELSGKMGVVARKLVVE